MASVSMNTANSRHDTGQFRSVKAREPWGLEAVDVFAPVDLAGAKSGAGSPVVSHRSHSRWLRTVFERLTASCTHVARNRVNPAAADAIGTRCGNCNAALPRKFEI
jgi:hypothetical protein